MQGVRSLRSVAGQDANQVGLFIADVVKIQAFLDMIRKAGFEQAKYRNLTLGIACLHSGWKL